MNNEILIRIEKFRQFKEQIRGSEDYLIVAYVSHLKSLIAGFYTHIANNTSNLLILLQIKKI